MLRQGFADADRALEELAELGDPGRELVAIIGRSAEPSAALSALVRLADAVDDRDKLLTALAADEGTAMRLISVLGASAASAPSARHSSRNANRPQTRCSNTLPIL